MKCNQCKGTGYVTKYILPDITDLVKCLGCNGAGKALIICPECGQRATYSLHSRHFPHNTTCRIRQKH